MLKSVASTISPRPHNLDLIGYSLRLSIAKQNSSALESLVVAVRIAPSSSDRFGLADIDRRGVEARFDVGGVVFLDHLDAGAAVLGDLVDVRAFHQAQADVGVAQAVGRARLSFAVDFQVFFVEDRVEELRGGSFGK